VGKTTRAEASITKLRELNPHVKVDLVSALSPEELKKYNVVCVTEVFNNIDEVI